MYNYLLSEENKKFREGVHQFVKEAVPPLLLQKIEKYNPNRIDIECPDY